MTNDDLNNFIAAARDKLKADGKWQDVDEAALEMLRINLDLMIKSKASIDADGLFTVGERGHIVANPAVKMFKDFQTKAVAIMQDYGLTALSRKKLDRGDPPKEEPSPLEEFLKNANR